MQTRTCPALLISAPASHSGKTTVTAALARYWTQQGKTVRVFKTGPDFLDPMLLEHASGAAVHQLDLRAGRIGRVILQLGARVAHRFGGVERNVFFNHQLLQLLVEPRQIGFQAGNIQIVATAVAFGEAAFLFNQGNGFGRHHIRICALQRNGLAAAQHQRACRNHQSFHFISPIGLLFFRRPVQPCVWP